MEYNTLREQLKMSEYGRYVKQMIDFINTMPDKSTRTKAAHAVVQAMMTVQQGPRDMVDYKRKLWDHLVVLSDFSLDVDSPYPVPKPDEKAFPEILNYTVPYEVKFRFYGKYLEQTVKKALEMEDGDDRQELVRLIANTMKKLYLTWNKDNVKDEVIFDQLAILSGGKLVPEAGLVLQDSADILKNNRPAQRPGTWPQKNQNNKNRKKNFRKKQ